MKPSDKWELRDIGIVLFLLFLTLFIVFGVLSPFGLDDFQSSYMISNYGFTGILKERYLHWHAYVRSGFANLLYRSLGNMPRGFNYSVLINTFLLVVVLSVFQMRFIRLAGRKKKIFGITILVICSLSISPLFHSLIMWWAQKAALLASAIFTAISLWLSTRLVNKSKISNWPLHFIVMMLAASFSELSFIFLALGNSYIWWSHYKKIDEVRWRQTAFFNLLCMATTALAVLIGPAQFEYIPSLPKVLEPDFFSTIIQSINIPQYADYHLTHFAMIFLGTFCYLCLNPRLKLKVTGKVIGIIGITICFAVIAIYMAKISGRETLAPRISNMLLILLFLFTVLLSVKFYQETSKQLQSFNPPQWANSLVLIFLLLTALYQGHQHRLFDAFLQQGPKAIDFIENIIPSLEKTKSDLPDASKKEQRGAQTPKIFTHLSLFPKSQANFW